MVVAGSNFFTFASTSFFMWSRGSNLSVMSVSPSARVMSPPARRRSARIIYECSGEARRDVLPDRPHNVLDVLLGFAVDHDHAVLAGVARVAVAVGVERRALP